MKLHEVASLAADRPGRFAVTVWADGDDLVAEVDGVTYRATNPFLLDSMLTDGGAPAPRDIYFVDEPAWEDPPPIPDVRDQALERLDSMNAEGEISYAVYSELHDLLAAASGILPGRSEGEVKAEALTEAAQRWSDDPADDDEVTVRNWLLARAAELRGGERA